MSRIVLLLISTIVFAAGCSEQTSTEEMIQARESLLTLVGQVNEEAHSGERMLTQARMLHEQGELQTMKLLTTIQTGIDINKRIASDVQLIGLPAELAAYRDRILQALGQRDSAYRLLFDSYDSNQPALEVSGDTKLQEAIHELDKIKQELHLFGK